MDRTLISRLVILYFACAIIFAVAVSGQSPVSPSSSGSLPAASTTDLSLLSSSSLALSPSSLKQILLDAFKQLLAAPMKLAKLLVQEVNQIIKNRDFRELFDVKVVKQLLSKAPKRLFAYYDALIGMESHCLKRTVCDIAEFTSRRIPKWLEQILFIYFNTFSASKPYYEVIVHGLTVKNCAFMYSECNPEEFLNRLRTNITQTIATTVAPFKAALDEVASLESPEQTSRPMVPSRPTLQQLQQLQLQQQQQQRPRPQDTFEQDENNARIDEESQNSETEFEALMNERRFRQQQQQQQQQRNQRPQSSGQFGSFE